MNREEQQLWMGAYLAAYAIQMFQGPGLEPRDLDKTSTKHADFVVAKSRQIKKEEKTV